MSSLVLSIVDESERSGKSHNGEREQKVSEDKCGSLNGVVFERERRENSELDDEEEVVFESPNRELEKIAGFSEAVWEER